MDCEVIKDLIPLHVEKLASEASNKLILEHIKDCEDCKGTLKKLEADFEIGNVEAAKIVEKVPENLIQRIRDGILLKIIASVLVMMISAKVIGYVIFLTRTPMFMVFLYLVSICSFTAAIFLSYSISKGRSTLRKCFISMGRWSFVFSIIFCFIFFINFFGYFSTIENMVTIIVLEIIYNIVLNTTLIVYAKFKLPKEVVAEGKNRKNNKLSIIAFSTLFAIAALTAVPIVLLEKNKIVDNIDLPFIADKDVLGTWTAVDYVKSQEQFNADELSKGKRLFIKEITFLKDGRIIERFSKSDSTSYRGNIDFDPTPWLFWTKNYVIDRGGDHMTNKYEIREIKGIRYLFIEWKTGDYSYFHKSPRYYVLKYEG